jgi:ADP-ribosylglycohydrolase
VLAVLILTLTAGAKLPDAVVTAKALLEHEPQHEETLRCILLAEELANSALTPDIAIARLGEGWIAEEALAISIYCALVARNFEQGVILAVNHDGDSDSTGAEDLYMFRHWKIGDYLKNKQLNKRIWHKYPGF